MMRYSGKCKCGVNKIWHGIPIIGDVWLIVSVSLTFRDSQLVIILNQSHVEQIRDKENLTWGYLVHCNGCVKPGLRWWGWSMNDVIMTMSIKLQSTNQILRSTNKKSKWKSKFIKSPVSNNIPPLLELSFSFNGIVKTPIMQWLDTWVGANWSRLLYFFHNIHFNKTILVSEPKTFLVQGWMKTDQLHLLSLCVEFTYSGWKYTPLRDLHTFVHILDKEAGGISW